MFACLATDYARGPLPGQPDRIADAERRHRAGHLATSALNEVYDQAVAEVVSEQEASGLTIVSDGGVRWADPIAPIAQGLIGLRAGAGAQGGQPPLEVLTHAAKGSIAWRRPIFARAFAVTAACARQPIKQVVTGPYTLGWLSGLDGLNRVRATHELAEALNRELSSLVHAGCRVIQIQEDRLGKSGDNEAELALFREAHRRLTAGLDDPQYVHLSLGVCGESVPPTAVSALFDAPYSSYLFDLLHGPASWQAVLQAPRERGIVCGVADARSAETDEIEAIVHAIAYASAANGRGSTRVGIAPSGSLRGLERHHARRKIERLAKAIGVASVGPVEDVAVALAPHPTENRRYPGLQRLATGYQAACAALGLPAVGTAA